jgi:aryl-alcohol dehydrogenase-like predicted oxidoreductase
MSDCEVSLGQTEVCLPAVGTGAWSWGDRIVWGFGEDYDGSTVQGAFEASMQAGIDFFDTAEAYGRGKSERLLGRFIHSQERRVSVATKLTPFPWRLWDGTIRKALEASLERLDLPQVDLYQLHWPLPLVPVEKWADGLAEAVEAGLTRAVGVSNYNADQMRQMHTALQARGIPLASNQVEYSLYNRKVERNGVLEACRELGVTLIAYSPLGQGILTGKYTPENRPGGIRGWRYNRATLEKVQPLIREMYEIGQRHGEKTPAQVAINWLICKGTLPIPGAKNARQARENAGASGWHMTDEEVQRLDETSQEIQRGR